MKFAAEIEYRAGIIGIALKTIAQALFVRRKFCGKCRNELFHPVVSPYGRATDDERARPRHPGTCCTCEGH